MVLGRPRSAVPKDDMMPPGLQSTCASSCRGLAGHSLCRERVHGLCCFRGGAQPEHIRECCRESCPIGSARGGCFQAEPGLHKALAQGPAPLALPGKVARAVSRGRRGRAQAWGGISLSARTRPGLRYVFVGADALNSQRRPFPEYC